MPGTAKSVSLSPHAPSSSMKLKLLALIAVCAALVMGAVRYLPDSEGTDTLDSESASAADDPGSSNADGLAGPGAATAASGEAGMSASGRTQLEAGSLAAPQDEDVLSPKVGKITAIIEWPDGSTPSTDLRVYAFGMTFPGASLQTELSSNESTITYKRVKGELRQELERVNDSGKSLLKRAFTAAEVTESRDADGTVWIAEISLPPGRARAYLHAFGGGYGTSRAVEARLGEAAVTLRPQMRASLTVAATTEEPGADLAGSYVIADIESDRAAQAATGPDADAIENRYKAERGLGEGGETVFEGVPPNHDLRVRVFHDTLAPAEATVARLDAGEQRHMTILLLRGVDVTGRVIDADGRSITGAHVTAAIPGQTFGLDDEIFRSTLSAEQGTFRLTGLPDGVVVIRAAKTGALQSGRQLVALTQDSNHPDLELVLEDGKSIEGTARFAGGEPAAGLTVRANFDPAHMMGPSVLGASRGGTNEAITLKDGSFKIAGLGSGPFALRVSTEPDAAGPGEGEGIRTAQLDGVTPGQAGVELVLAPTSRISGVCRDDLGELVRRLPISCVRIVAGSLGDVRFERKSETTDDEGAFAFEGLSAGSWAISMVTETHVTPEEVGVEVVTEAANGATETVIEVMAMRSCTITGTVLDPDGSPIGGIRVGQATEGPSWRDQVSGEPKASPTISREDGTFVLLGVAPGKVKLEATSDSLAPVASDSLDAPAGGRLENITLRMNRGGTIEGVCFNDEGKTVSGRLITIQSASMDTMRTLTTASDGTFRQTGLTPGRYQVIALDTAIDASNDIDGSGIASMMANMKMATASVEEGEIEYLFLGAPPAAPVKVEGKVTLAGEPVAGAMVAWLPATTGMYGKMKITSTNKDGQYSITLDDTGEFRIQIGSVENGAAGQQRTSEFSAEIAQGREEFERDFEVPGGAIAGRVTYANGDPAPGVRLSITGDGGVRTDRLMGSSYAETMTSADGTYDVSGLSPGTYQVMAGGPLPLSDSAVTAARVISKSIKVGENSRVEGIDLELVEPGQAEVTVRGAGGGLVAGVGIFLRDDKGRHTELISMVTTNSEGSATLKGIAPGRYSAAARGETTASQESAYFEVSAGETATVDLLMEPGASLLASLKVKGGGETPPASIQVLDSQGMDVTRRIGLVEMRSTVSDRPVGLREKRVGPLAPGRYTVIATAENGLKARRRVNLDAGDEKTVTLLLK
ncbi:MAG: protocatechuate 3,4-dioxygenase beta subunit [Planctomycetota bacterium]